MEGLFHPSPTTTKTSTMTGNLMIFVRLLFVDLVDRPSYYNCPKRICGRSLLLTVHVLSYARMFSASSFTRNNADNKRFCQPASPTSLDNAATESNICWL